MASDVRQKEEEATRQRSGLLGHQYLDAREIDLTQIPADLMTIDEIREKKVLPVSINPPHLTLAYDIDTPKSILESLEQKFVEYVLSYRVISRTGFNEILRVLDPPPIMIDPNIVVVDEGVSANFAQISAQLSQKLPREVLNFLIKQAYLIRTSDIHIEPQKRQVRVRFRIDGTLHPIATIDHEQYRIMLGDLSNRSGISNNVSTPQSGRMGQEFIDENNIKKTINMRVETVPSIYGQDTVIRIFNMEVDSIELDALGFDEYTAGNLAEIIAKPTGMVMMVGPTGSGKSTTLYALINKLNSPHRKIVSLEDPVEYEIPGITQVPVQGDSQNGFGEMLRAVMREDPDVIMVGEIRDADTAKTALQAALTGHLVLCTFHANNASAAISRMMDMIGYNPMLASAIRMIMGQRLVRNIRPEAAEEFDPPQHIKDQFSKELSQLNDKSIDTSSTKFLQPKKEEPLPYEGRTVIAEQLLLTPDLEKLIMGTAKGITAQEIESVAVKNGMRTMLQDGFKKVHEGKTTLEEVFRVV